MKTKFITFNTIGFVSIILLLCSLNSCKKYEEGPSLSLRSKAERVSNTWKVETYIKNGVDETIDFQNKKSNYQETYTKNSEYNYSYIDNKGDSESGDGKWSFDNNDLEIKRSGVSGQSSVTLTILKLKEKEFWYWYMDGSDRKEFHLIPN